MLSSATIFRSQFQCMEAEPEFSKCSQQDRTKQYVELLKTDNKLPALLHSVLQNRTMLTVKEMAAKSAEANA